MRIGCLSTVAIRLTLGSHGVSARPNNEGRPHETPPSGSPVHVTPICLALGGDMPDHYGYGVGEERARATVEQSSMGGEPVDTANNYGMAQRGAHRRRLAGAWRAPQGFVISTSSTATPRRAVRRRPRAPLARGEPGRLGLDRVQVLHLHDPEHARDLGEITGKGGALEELFRMKEEGSPRPWALPWGGSTSWSRCCATGPSTC
jgi:D-threo-aldose 1-dehydrogenase